LTYDLEPNWFDWTVNGKPLTTMAEVFEEDGFIHSVVCKPQMLPKDVGDLREETEKYLMRTVIQSGFTKFAVLLSGIDSEIIGRYLKKIGVDVEFYYTKFWFESDEVADIVKGIGKELDVPVHIVDWEWYKDRHSMFFVAENSFQPCSVKNVHIHTIQQIPEDRYIFIGSRNIEIYFPPRYLHKLAKDRHPNWHHTGRKLFIDTRQFSNRFTLNHLERSGCGVFWNNDAGCASSIFRDSRLEVYDRGDKAGDMDDKQIFFDLWDDCTFKAKTDPFVGGDYTYRWEDWYVGNPKSREKAAVMMQRRYLQRKYGRVYSVCGDILANKYDNTWTFGDMINIDSILER
tara:strand:+ start:407 stop:1438 length:1032 start_codon:yes stop_codon:yes gene_type:complete